MYGIINKAIEDLIVETYGETTWEAVKTKSGVDIAYFISNEPYDDSITYKLAIAIAEEVNMSLSEVLSSFGEWWILRTGREKYGGLLESGGTNFQEFMINLPAFHNRIMLMYPKLTPPEFKISDITENSIHVHYFSQRKGLHDFVNGLLIGIGKLYQTPIEVCLIQSRQQGFSHEIFKVTWP